MTKKQQKETKRLQLPRAPAAITILALIALGLSVYLAWSTWTGNTRLAGCGEDGADCEAVIGTRWGTFFGIPVSAGGLLVYAGIFGVSLAMRKVVSRNQWLGLLFLSVVASASAVWFISLQIFEIKSYCWYCMAVHACGLIIMLTVFRRIPLQVLNAGHVLRAVAAAFAGVAVLAGGQLYTAHNPQGQPPSISSPVDRQPQVTPSPAPVIQREVTIGKGKLRFPIGDFPVFGLPDAGNVAAHFFDFTCPACREFHSTLMATHRPYENKTALVMIPVPLDAACNPAVRETSYIHQNACAFARIGLALWRIAPQAYESYDRFLFQNQYPPSAEAARDVADQLAGKEAMDQALSDPEVTRILKAGMQMFYSPAMEQKGIPALVTKDQFIVGFPPPGLLPQLFAAN